MISRHANTIGVISDTHGLLRPEVLKHFSDCDLILHAGDIGNEQIIRQLNKLAPIFSVHGNVDTLHLCKTFPRELRLCINGINFYMTHIPNMYLPKKEDIKQNIVIFGHTHRPNEQESLGTTYLNPGSAGPTRYNLPPTVMKLTYSQNQNIFNTLLIELTS